MFALATRNANGSIRVSALVETRVTANAQARFYSRKFGKSVRVLDFSDVSAPAYVEPTVVDNACEGVPSAADLLN